MVAKLQAELEALANHQDVAAVLAEASKKRDDDTEASRLERVANAVEAIARSIGARANTGARLVEALKVLIPLERQAWKIDDGDGGGGGDEGAMKRLSDAERASRLASILERARQRASATGKDGDGAG